MTFGVAPPPPLPRGFEVPLASLGMTGPSPADRGFTLAQEPGVVAEAIRETRTHIYSARDRLMDEFLKPYLKMRKAWWCPWVKRFPTRTDALVFLEQNPTEAYTEVATYREADIEKLENIEDRLHAQEFRAHGTGVILPNSEFNLISYEYSRMGASTATVLTSWRLPRRS